MMRAKPTDIGNCPGIHHFEKSFVHLLSNLMANETCILSKQEKLFLEELYFRKRVRDLLNFY